MKLRIENVNKQYKSVQALKDINLEIQTNKFTTLLGPSGCGKTTLLKIIAGLETPDSGEIYFNDWCVFSKEKKINVSPQKRQLGMVFQEFALWPHMTVFNNVAFPLKARKLTASMLQAVSKAMKMVKLEGFEKRYPNQLSGGQQQRVAFARAVVSNPDLLLFDEPLSALDAVLREEMRSELCALVKQINATAIFVTHDQIEAMTMSDVIVVMNKGEVIQQGSPEEIYQQPASKDVIQFIGKTNWKEKSAIRPEHVSLNQTQGADEIKAVVKQVAYMGEKYEITVETESKDVWVVYNNTRMAIGDACTLYANGNDYIQFG